MTLNLVVYSPDGVIIHTVPTRGLTGSPHLGLAQALPQPQKKPTCPHLDLGLVASRPGRRYVLVIGSHPFCGPL